MLQSLPLNPDHLIAALQLLACLYIAYRGILSLNNMTRSTRHVMRLSMAMITAAAACGAVTSIPKPDVVHAVLAAGFALYFYGDLRHHNHG